MLWLLKVASSEQAAQGSEESACTDASPQDVTETSEGNEIDDDEQERIERVRLTPLLSPVASNNPVPTAPEQAAVVATLFPVGAGSAQRKKTRRRQSGVPNRR